MRAITRRHTWLTTVAFLGVLSVGLAALPDKAQGEVLGLSNNEFSVISGPVTLSQFYPNLRVDSATVGDSAIFMPIHMTLGRKILGVFVCYSTSNARTFITATILASHVTPNTPPTLLFIDNTDQASTVGTCYASTPPGGVVANGAMLLHLTLHFGDPADHVFIGAIAVNLE